eukprot:259727-Chlamydomonas_euryale.AAC.2
MKGATGRVSEVPVCLAGPPHPCIRCASKCEDCASKCEDCAWVHSMAWRRAVGMRTKCALGERARSVLRMLAFKR